MQHSEIGILSDSNRPSLTISTPLSLFVNLAFFLSFFPYFKILPIDAEIQPLYALFAFMAVLLFLPVNRFLSLALAIMCLLVVNWYRSIVTGLPLVMISSQFVAFLAPLFLFLAIANYANLISPKLFISAVLAYFFLGMSQQLGIAGPLEPILKTIISRSETESLSGTRGVLFFACEPSYAAHIIFMMFVANFILKESNHIKKKTYKIINILIITMFIINKSATFALLFCIFFLTNFVVRFLKSSFLTKFIKSPLIILSLILGIWSLGVLVDRFSSSFRALEIVSIVFDIVKSGNLFTLDTLALLASKRFITVIVGYLSLMTNFGLGYGLGSYFFYFKELVYHFHIDWASLPLYGNWEILKNLKPQSYASQVAMDTGFAGLIVLILISYYVFKHITQCHAPKNVKNYLYAGFITSSFSIYFLSTTALPVPWVIYGLIIFYTRTTKTNVYDSTRINNNPNTQFSSLS